MGDSNPSPASRVHSQCSHRGVPGLLSVWFELVAGLREPGLISGFIAQPGACKDGNILLFPCFFFLSCFCHFFFLSLLFQISTSCHKNARAATVLLGHVQVTSGAHDPHFSPGAHSVPQATDPWIPPPGQGLQGNGAVCFLAPPPDAQCIPAPAFLRMAQWLAGTSESLCLSFSLPPPIKF